MPLGKWEPSSLLMDLTRVRAVVGQQQAAMMDLLLDFGVWKEGFFSFLDLDPH